MSDQPTIWQLEIPSNVAQQDVWYLEEQLGQIAGITTELREPRDFLAATLLFIQMVEPYAIQAIAIAGGINTLHDLAQVIYGFLHPKKQEIDQQSGKNKVVLKNKDKQIELYNLTSQQIEHVLKQ
jgi:hypothetical protein